MPRKQLGKKMGDAAKSMLTARARNEGSAAAEAGLIWVMRPDGTIWGHPPRSCSRIDAANRIRLWTDFLNLTDDAPTNVHLGIVDGFTVLITDAPAAKRSGPAIPDALPKPAFSLMMTIPSPASHREAGYGRISGRLDPDDL